jgi:hypothetical protein
MSRSRRKQRGRVLADACTHGQRQRREGFVNSRGEVAGAQLAKDGTVHPFLWTKGTGMWDPGRNSLAPS